MPAEPRPENDEPSSPLHSKLRRFDVLAPADHQTPPPSKQVEDAAVADDQDWDASDDTAPAGDPQHQPFVHVDLLTIRKEVQCPICLGIIKKTRTVMECMHRFCRECIDKSMRMGNNECPACRTHCPSRRSLRDDPRYDALIAALYPDIRKFEEEELAFHEEDDNRNKQIQDSIAEVLRKQSEVLGKKRSASKFGVGTSMTRPQRSCRNVNSRRRGRRRNTSPDYQDSDENSDSNCIDKHYDPDEHHAEIKKQRRGKSRASIGSSHSPSSTNLSGGSFDNNLDQRKEEKGLSPGLTYSTEMLAWGRGGVRSNTRSNSNNGGMSTGARRIHLTNLVDKPCNLEENEKEYVALQTSLKAENVHMFDAQDPYGSSDHRSTLEPSSSCNDNPSEVVGRLQDRLHILNRDESLSGAVASFISNGEQLVKCKRKKTRNGFMRREQQVHDSIPFSSSQQMSDNYN